METKFGSLFVVVFVVAGATAVNGQGDRRIRRTTTLASKTLYSEPIKDVPGPEKNYTGIRLNAESLLLAYYHEQTIAIVEVGRNRELFNCELLETKTMRDRHAALQNLKSRVPSQMKIRFEDMLDLMSQCQKLDFPLSFGRREFFSEYKKRSLKEPDPRELSSLLSGVFPGTKWCGTGDLALSYHDLGRDRNLDKCCRTHDYCPVKVEALKTQYNLTNYSLYSKSHCECDDMFYRCLKNIDTTAANFLGNIFFNVVRVMCVEDVSPDMAVMTMGTKRFSSRKKRF